MASMTKTRRRDLKIFIVASFAWLAFVHAVALPANDQVFPVLVAACIAYSFAMCKVLSVAPLARPFIAVTPALVALAASWVISRETGSFRHDRALLIGQSVAIAAFAYLLLTIYRVGKGYFLRASDWIRSKTTKFETDYVFRTPDGETDGLNTNRLFLDLENFRSRRFVRRKLKILFPKTEWEALLRTSFRDTRDQVSFAELSQENIRSHDLVVPLKISELVELDGLRQLLADNPIPIPSMESIVLCDDKHLLNKALIANGFGACVPEMGGRLPYPYILKKRLDECAANCHVVSNAEQELEYSELLDHPDYFRQRFVLGRDEYTTHILVRNGKIACAISIKFVFKDDLHTKGKGCAASYSRICRNHHLGLFAAILRSIDFDGLCCINYKIVDGRPCIFEINPRFGFSLAPWFLSFVRRIA